MLPGVAEMIADLHNHSVEIIVNWVCFRAQPHLLKERLGIRDVLGADLRVCNGAFTREVDRSFPLNAKSVFAMEHAKQLCCGMSEVLAVGDGLSEIPLFNAADASGAFIAGKKTRSHATVAAVGSDVAEP